MGILIWLGKNVGLILGIAETVVNAVVGIITQAVKVIAGIVNVLQPSRSQDSLVKLAEKLEGISAWITSKFNVVKAWLYNLGVPAK